MPFQKLADHCNSNDNISSFTIRNHLTFTERRDSDNQVTLLFTP